MRVWGQTVLKGSLRFQFTTWGSSGKSYQLTVQGFLNLYKEVLAPRPRVWWEANCDKACKAPTSQLVPNKGQFTFEQPWSPSGARTSYTGDDREMTQTCSESQEWGPTFISIMGIVQAECADSGTAGGRRKKQPSAAEVEWLQRVSLGAALHTPSPTLPPQHPPYACLTVLDLTVPNLLTSSSPGPRILHSLFPTPPLPRSLSHWALIVSALAAPRLLKQGGSLLLALPMARACRTLQGRLLRAFSTAWLGHSRRLTKEALWQDCKEFLQSGGLEIIPCACK